MAVEYENENSFGSEMSTCIAPGVRQSQVDRVSILRWLKWIIKVKNRKGIPLPAQRQTCNRCPAMFIMNLQHGENGCAINAH